MRHQVAALQRQVKKPLLSWADRAVLAALARVLPGSQLRQLRLIISPRTLLRWHAHLIRVTGPIHAALPDGPGPRSRYGRCAGDARDNPGWDTGASTASCRRNRRVPRQPNDLASRRHKDHRMIQETAGQRSWTQFWHPQPGRRRHSLRGTVMDFPWTCRPPTVDPALRRCSGRRVNIPVTSASAGARVTLRWRGSRPRTDTTHCPISRYQLQR